MKQCVPDYYTDFRCLAADCRHTCCRGWEIDIDAATLEAYLTLPGALGQELRAKISMEDCPHFILDEEENCPFLEKSGLCRLIRSLGTQSLCQICRDHPRFRNFFSDRTEIGLGLCCEAAGALILKRREKMILLPQGTEQLTQRERDFLTQRMRLFSIAQDRTCPMAERIARLLETANAAVPQKTPPEWALVYMGLERLEETWTEQLTALAASAWPLPIPEGAAWEIAWEQLLVYFLYRHLTGALEDGRLDVRVAFCVLSCQMILALCSLKKQQTGSVNLDDLVQLARQYSSEVEYSEENLETLLELLWE